MKTEQYPDYDWDKIPTGSIFTANILGTNSNGRIVKEHGMIYLCQNEKNGANAALKLGYKNSWCIRNGSYKELQRHGVQYLQVWLDPTFEIPKTIALKIGNHKAIVTKDFIQAGCTIVKFKTVERVYKTMLKFRKT